MNKNDLKFHKACLVLPDMEPDAYATLKKSIKQGYDPNFPIVLLNGKILDGRHRYNACKETGTEPVFVEYTGERDPYDYVWHIHASRRSWESETQKVICHNKLATHSKAMRAEVEAIQAAADAARSEAAKGNKNAAKSKTVVGTGTLPLNKKEQKKKENKARKAEADMLGVGENAVKDAHYIMNNDPELAEQVAQKKIPAKKAKAEIKKKKRAAEIEAINEKIEKEGTVAPDGLYDVIVIDPPWAYGRDYDPDGSRVANPYPEMNQAALLDLEIPAKPAAILYLWTTHAFMRDALDLVTAWGFEDKAILVWNKQKMGIGHWVRMQCEFVILATCGKPKYTNTEHRDIIEEPRREHSRKPESFYKMVEAVTAGRRLDYFSRQEREGWATFGAEAGKYGME